MQSARGDLMWMKSLINHAQVEIVINESREFGNMDVAEYHGWLVYKNITRRQHTTNTYGEIFMQLTQETFHKGANWSLELVRDWRGTGMQCE